MIRALVRLLEVTPPEVVEEVQFLGAEAERRDVGVAFDEPMPPRTAGTLHANPDEIRRPNRTAERQQRKSGLRLANAGTYGAPNDGLNRAANGRTKNTALRLRLAQHHAFDTSLTGPPPCTGQHHRAHYA